MGPQKHPIVNIQAPKRLYNLDNYAANTHMSIQVYIRTTTDIKQVDSRLPLDNDLINAWTNQ